MNALSFTVVIVILAFIMIFYNLVLVQNGAQLTSSSHYSWFYSNKSVPNITQQQKESQRLNTTNSEVPKYETRYITWASFARLGNLLFQYVTTYMTGLKTNKMFIIDGNTHAWDLLRCFPNLKVKYVNKSFKNSISFKNIHVPLSAVYDKGLVEKSMGHKNVCLSGALQSWKYFLGYEDDIRQQLKPDDRYINKATSQLKMFSEKYKSQFNTTERNSLNLTYIGVHVRRGDMATKFLLSLGFKTASDGYIKKAMGYYRSKYKHAIFIVCSNGMDWCKSNIRQPSWGNDTYFSSGNTIEDFVLLANCNNSIITVGSYGWWSGWLAGGQVVYYSLYPVPGSGLSKRFNSDDYYPHGWIPMK